MHEHGEGIISKYNKLELSGDFQGQSAVPDDMCLYSFNQVQIVTRKTAGTAENPAANKLSFVTIRLRW